MPPLCESSSLAAIIKNCAFLTSLKAARRLHALVLTTIAASSISPYPYNIIISMYARCGSLGDSRLVFDTMPQRSLVSFNALIAAHSRNPDDAPFAFKLLSQMEVEGFRPNGSTFTSLIQASSSLENRALDSLLHAQVVRVGLLSDVCVQTALVGMYSSSQDLESARRVFGWIVDKDVVAWNSMMFGLLKFDKAKEALHFFDSMLKTDIVPTQFTYSIVLNACGRLGDHHSGELIHAQVIVSNTQVDLPLQNSLLDMYCNCGNTEAAFEIFKRMDITDLVSWNTIIAGYAENGTEEKAIDLFVQLHRHSLPKPDEYTFAAICSATAVLPDYGKPLHAQVIKAGLGSSVFVGSILVSMYFKNCEAEAAQNVFDIISEKDVVLWTEMISGHSRMGNAESAMKYFHEMYKEDYKIDSFSLSGALSACADLATWRQGEMIHSQALKTGYHVEMSVCGSLIDMYAKNGNLEAARLIFSDVQHPDLKCFNSMLGGYSHHGKIEQALTIFLEIQSHDCLRPDQVTFLSLLSACNHSGLVETGMLLWNYMKENGFTHGIKHYSCMVSLLSRAGLLEEVEDMIIKSPFTDENLELWRTLLSSCVVNKNLSVGVHAAEQVLILDAQDSATHILLTNLYAAAGKWDDVAEMRRNMRKSMVEKDPGLSWIDDQKNIQAFFSGLQSHSQVDEAKSELQRLRGNMSTDVDEYNV